MIKNMTGLRNQSKEDIIAAGPDNVPAVITDQSGAPQGPATIKEGEFVFSIEAIIGAGDGDYEHGLEVIMNIHDQLKARGEEVLRSQSIAGAAIE